MSILLDKDSRVIVQGITGRDGSFHTRRMKAYHTNIVGGVTPGKEGKDLDGIPVFNSVEKAVKETEADISVIFVPAHRAADAVFEAAGSGISLIVVISEGIPVLDMAKIIPYLIKCNARMIGPNSPGMISPEIGSLGIFPTSIVKKGSIGVISRSGTLTYEIVHNLSLSGLGQSTCVGVGGDQIIGMRFIDYLELFEKDPQTEAVVLIGEIGGTDEQEAARYINRNMTKPVVSFIAGKTAPPGKRMGHAGAIISGGDNTAQAKIQILQDNQIKVINEPGEIGDAVRALLS